MNRDNERHNDIPDEILWQIRRPSASAGTHQTGNEASPRANHLSLPSQNTDDAGTVNRAPQTAPRTSSQARYSHTEAAPDKNSQPVRRAASENVPHMPANQTASRPVSHNQINQGANHTTPAAKNARNTNNLPPRTQRASAEAGAVPRNPSPTQRAAGTSAQAQRAASPMPRRAVTSRAPAGAAPQKARTAPQNGAEHTRTIDRVDTSKEKNSRGSDGSSGSTMSSVVKAILYIVIVVAVAGLLSYYIIMFGNDMYAFVKSDEEVEVTIPEYATVEEIAEILGDAGVVKYPSLLVLYAKMKKIDKTYEFVAGDYTVNGMMNYDELFYEFVKHKSYETVRITIPEGYTVDEIINLMTENGIGTREGFIDVINNYDFDFDFVKALDASDLTGRTYRLEGYLYPDTYEFYKSSSEATVIYKLLSRFDMIFSDDFYELSAKLGFSVDETIILASMIEKEARYSADYEQVSSVFHNRLNNPSSYPKLESDATIMYAIQVRDGERKATLTSEDLNYDTPYNTYLYDGLPPGPIANPGYEAITCALYPAKTNYYFFVSDNYGNTYFSKTLAQHNAAVEKVKKINSEG